MILQFPDQKAAGSRKTRVTLRRAAAAKERAAILGLHDTPRQSATAKNQHLRSARWKVWRKGRRHHELLACAIGPRGRRMVREDPRRDRSGRARDQP
jgi:hypothetical protein